jgi:hypothetical protein
VGEKVVAQIEFDVAGNTDDHPAGEELEDTFAAGDGNDEQRIDKELLAAPAKV